jgi:hypothetical protein
MGYSIGQLEAPTTPGHKKFVKKSRKRKLRQQVRKNIESQIFHNRYKGYS